MRANLNSQVKELDLPEWDLTKLPCDYMLIHFASFCYYVAVSVLNNAKWNSWKGILKHFRMEMIWEHLNQFDRQIQQFNGWHAKVDGEVKSYQKKLEQQIFKLFQMNHDHGIKLKLKII